MVFMDKQIVASQTFVRELLAKKSGAARLDFDEESRLLYDAVAPTHTEDDFKVRRSRRRKKKKKKKKKKKEEIFIF